MVESLKDITIAAKLLRSTLADTGAGGAEGEGEKEGAKEEKQKSLVDVHYELLNTDIAPLDPSSKVWSLTEDSCALCRHVFAYARVEVLAGCVW